MVKLIRQGIQLRNINEIKNLLISQKNSFLNSPDRHLTRPTLYKGTLSF